jgi:hypothetical protein
MSRVELEVVDVAGEGAMLVVLVAVVAFLL